MKINTRKFLVFSYALSGKPVTYAHLDYLWSELTAGGRRGLIAYLLKQRLIFATYSGRTVTFMISSIGKAWVEEQYFRKQANQESGGKLVIFYPGVSLSDQKIMPFKQLLKNQLMEISPRVYLSTGQLSDDLLSQIKRKYFAYVAVADLREWVVGDPNTFQKYYLHKKELENSLSGLSTELSGLIIEKKCFSLSNHQSNLKILSLLDRIFGVFELSREQSFPGDEIIESGKEILIRYSQLF